MPLWWRMFASMRMMTVALGWLGWLGWLGSPAHVLTTGDTNGYRTTSQRSICADFVVALSSRVLSEDTAPSLLFSASSMF